MRIVVTGREGQVVRALMERGAAAGHHIVAVGRPALDLAGSADAIGKALADARPDAIVSAAAYTMVDKAESERDLAFAINASGAGAVAQAARALGVPVVHLSTDYVFDGTKPAPYAESDATGPVGVYGASKLAGEHAVLAAQPDAAVLRTAWVYSPFGANFAKTMLRLAATRDELGVVGDQLGNPTSALDIADGVIAVAANLLANRDPALRGVFHMTSAGEASWAEFASAILAESVRLGGPTAGVRAITTAEYPTPAPRPANSRLDCRLIETAHGVRLPAWHSSVGPIVARLTATSS
ncbi:dTDP-4-dehydrorhamnose reductase [Novosphingobium lentum]|uniref:dTDP-4-dehydrorhamnose reductase n=1 Tax=Novosphingobium lentum TaxID=145287 RepID=UPI000831DAAE|nr:dTDP-4-dehydrorhamnose reductase [Novosphingobium lentum]